MKTYQELNFLPAQISNLYGAELHKAEPTEAGVYRLVGIRQTQSRSYEEQRIIVLVLDENGFPIPRVMVAFSYSTAEQYMLDDQFKWQPPHPRRAFIVPTGGGGQIDQIQGSAVKPGEPGGVTVYILEPEFASDVVTGAGMLADHSGLHLTFQLRRTGVRSLSERLDEVEARLDKLEA